jgi:molecular chaperone DnaJ
MVKMASKRDYYEVLGVARTAATKEIADAYRKAAIKYHPDKNPGDEEAVLRFKEAAEAFEVLGDQEKRSRYDRYGHSAFQGAAGSHFHDVSDIFEAFGDILGGGLFGDLFGGGRRDRRPQRGADIASHVTLELVEAARGVTKTVEFERHEACETCGGTGAKAGSQPETCSYCRGRGQVVQASGIFRVQTTCPACRGRGSVIKEVCKTCRGEAYLLRRIKREVVIPAGVDGHTRMRLAGEGEPSPDGGRRGDCYVIINVKDHPLFQREGHDLICRVPILFTQAALGATIEVPTLDGPEELKLPAGTQTGQVFSLRGRGVPDPRGGGVGNLLVQVEIDVPKSLSPEQEQLLRELAEVERTNVTPRRQGFLEKLKSYFNPPEEPPKRTKDKDPGAKQRQKSKEK